MDESIAPSGTAGAPQGSKSKGVRTPLHLAAYHDSAEVLQLLLDTRANVASCVKGALLGKTSDDSDSLCAQKEACTGHGWDLECENACAFGKCII